MLSFKPAFSLSSFTFIKSLFYFSLLSAIRLVSSAYLKLLIFKTQHPKNEDHGIRSCRFMTNRQENNENNDRLFLGLQNNCGQ